jgi:hypothetical protein
VDCHSLATGGGLAVVPGSVLGESQGLKTPPLRDLYVKTGFDRSSGQSRRGFGFGHDGSAQTIAELLQAHFAPGATAQQRADLEAFLFCFPSGTHPAVGTQITVDAGNRNSAATAGTLATLTSLADSGAVGLVASARVGGVRRSYLYAGGGVMRSDRLAETATVDGLRAAAGAGTEATFTAVVAGSERRAIDRDGDGYLDQDEVDAGSNPRDGASVPPSACRPVIAQAPAGVSTWVGRTVVLSAQASGAVTLRWRKDGVDVADSARVSGAGTGTLTITGVAAGDAGVYALAATNGCGETVSAGAGVAVYCKGDFNQSGAVELTDIFAFLAAWFGGSAAADVNANGAVELGDIFAFLNAWFAGC